jgi:hypothetical protein
MAIATTRYLQRVANLDANESAFLNRQLQHVEVEVYGTERPSLPGRRLIPVDNSAGAGVSSIVWRQTDSVGMAAIVSANARNLPTVDIQTSENMQGVKQLAVAYAYTEQEIEQARRLNISLDAQRGQVAFEAIELLIDQLMWYGDDNHKIPGLFSNAAIPDTSVAADGNSNGGSSSTEWQHKTPDQIIRDVTTAVRAIPENTLDLHRADTVCMPIEQMSHIATTPRSGTSDTTILQFLKEALPEIRNWESSFRFKAVPQFSNTDILMAYKKTPSILKCHVPVEFTQRMLRLEGLRYVVPCTADFAGVTVYRPMAMNIVKGI